jgi:hypothetical protein
MFPESPQRHGHHRSPNRTAEPLAKSVCGRLVGSIRRECLDHVIVLGEKHLRRILKSYFYYYLGSRTDLSLAKDAPATRVVRGRRLDRSWRSRSLAACTIATNGVLPNRLPPPYLENGNPVGASAKHPDDITAPRSRHSTKGQDSDL